MGKCNHQLPFRGYATADCTLPIAHQVIAHQQVFNNQAIRQASEAQKTRKFQNRQSRRSDAGAINQLNSHFKTYCISRKQCFTSPPLNKLGTIETVTSD